MRAGRPTRCRSAAASDAPRWNDGRRPLSRLEIKERIDQMPLLRFNILEGRTDAEIEKLLDTAHAAVVAAFHVPEGDRYQLVSEYRPGRMIALDTGLGIARTSRVVLVEGTS